MHKSAEDYLEQILILLETKGYARSVDIAEALEVKKPSVSIAMKKLRENGYVFMDKRSRISLTDKGYPIARQTYERHKTLARFLAGLGVDEETARKDACRMEHDLSNDSFEAIARCTPKDGSCSGR